MNWKHTLMVSAAGLAALALVPLIPVWGTKAQKP